MRFEIKFYVFLCTAGLYKVLINLTLPKRADMHFFIMDDYSTFEYLNVYLKCKTAIYDILQLDL